MAHEFITLNKLVHRDVAATLAQLYIAQTSEKAPVFAGPGAARATDAAQGWRAWSADTFTSFARLCDEPNVMAKLLLDVCMMAHCYCIFYFCCIFSDIFLFPTDLVRKSARNEKSMTLRSRYSEP